MESDDITHRVLVEIRDDIRGTNARLDGTNSRIDKLEAHLEKKVDGLGDRLDARIDALTDRVVQSEIRIATVLTDVAGTLHEMRDMMRGRYELRDRVERCEQDIADLKQRVH